MKKTLLALTFAAALAGPFAWFSAPAAAAVQLAPEQQQAADKLRAKGALVMPLSADGDGLVVNLALLGKAAIDDDLALVKALPKVQHLDLAGTAVTDAGLASLAGLKDLERLHLERTAVGDAGLAHLKGLEKLVYLNLYGTAVTDQGVAQLSGLKKLKGLYLWQTKVSDAGAAALKQAVPGVTINRGEELAATPPPAGKAIAKPAEKPTAAPVAKPADPAPAKPAAKAGEKPAAAVAGPATPVAAVAPAAGPVNTKCPISGHAVDPAFTFTFEGKVVGLCCDKCQAKFAKEPKTFIDKVVADAGKGK